MQITTEKYMWKPVVVDAVQVTAENFLYVALWCQGEINDNNGNPGQEPIDPNTHHIKVRVHSPKSPRQWKAYVGDWILYTPHGYKVYTPRAFKRAFQRVEAY